MRVSVECLLEGVAQTLLEQVLPRLEGRVARGQLYAAVEVLRNLEPRADWAEARVESWPEAPPADRVRAARATLCQVFAWLDELPPAAADAAQLPLGSHLAAQAVRDVSRLAPGSLLEEVSRG